MYCKYCGTENGDNASFCRGCGKQISSTRHIAFENERRGGNEAGEKRRRSSLRKPLIIIGIVAVVVAFALGGGMLFWHDNPESANMTTTEDALEALARANGGNLPEICFDEETGEICFIDGAHTDRTIGNADDAIASLSDVAPLYGINDARKEFRLVQQDELDGVTFYRLQQYYQGVEVYGRQLVIAVDVSGVPSSLSGSYTNIDKIDVNPTISQAEALSNLEERGEVGSIIRNNGLFLYEGVDTTSLTWSYDSLERRYLVSATNGEIIDTIPLACSEAVACKGDTENGERDVPFVATTNGDGIFYLEDESRGLRVFDGAKAVVANGVRGLYDKRSKQLIATIGADGNASITSNGKSIARWDREPGPDGGITVYGASGEMLASNLFMRYTWAPSSGVAFNLAESKSDKWNNKRAVSLMRYASLTYDFYAGEPYRRLGYDGYGGGMDLFYDAAFCRDDDDEDGVKYNDVYGKNAMSLGPALEFGYDYKITFERVAHEYTHSVEGCESDMIYRGESGALKEAYSDIMAFIATDSKTWKRDNGRNAADPNSDSYPAKRSDSYWKNPLNYDDGDGGGMHTNCTVIAHVAYLMKEEGISSDDLGHIWYGSLHYLSPNANFTTCRAAVIASAKALGYSDTVVNIIKSAFDDAGIAGGTTALTPEADIHVLNSDGSPHDGFDIKLTTKLAFHSNGDERWAHVDGSTKKLNEIMTDPLLGNEPIATGAYLLSITDSEGSGNTKALYVAVHNQGLAQFDVNLGTEASEPHEADKTDEGSANLRSIAEEFMRAWFGDWVFEDGKASETGGTISSRCLPYIAPSTELYLSFEHVDEHPSSATASEYARNFAACIVDCDTTMIDETRVLVNASGAGTQQGFEYITQEMYNQSLANGWHVSYILTFDGSGKITKIEDGTTADTGTDNLAATYESALNAYRSGLNSDTQPAYDDVNPEAWIAREHNKGLYAYALYDINGDGSDELLIGLEESTPVSEEGLEVYYRLYDLFTLDNGKPVRVLGDDGMTSLGYRAFCIPCENNIIATGGSGGATYHIREYWRLGEKANEMSLSDRVTMDADEYTFEDGDGKSEVLSGEQARSRYEKDVIARYTPITKFVWHTL